MIRSRFCASVSLVALLPITHAPAVAGQEAARGTTAGERVAAAAHGGTTRIEIGGFRLDPGAALDLVPSWSETAAISPGLASPKHATPVASKLDLESVRLGLFQDEAPQPPQTAAPPSTDPDDWRFEAYAAAWVPVKFKGTFTIDGVNSNIDIDLETILDDLEGLVEGGFELTNDEWSFVVWGLYVKLETDIETRTLFSTVDTTLDYQMGIIDMALSRRIGTWPLGSSETARWSFDVMGGLRYWSIDIEVSVRGPFGIDPSGTEDDEWVDPFVGGRFLFDFSDKFDLLVRADVGGFGIGSASDLSWSVAAIGTYELAPNASLVAGYRYLDIDWSNGSGRGKTEYDFYLHGPIVGLRIAF